MTTCCVSGCKNRYSTSSSLKFYRIPTGSRPFQANRRRLWLQAIQKVNGSTEELKDARICGAHFVSGEASMDHERPDFVPSVFTCAQQSQKKVKWFYGRRKRRRRKAKAEKEEEMTSPGADAPQELKSPVLMESELPQDVQMSSTPSSPKVGKTSTRGTKAETESKTIQLQTTSSRSKTSPSFKAPAGIPKLDKSPVVLLWPVFAPESGYRCELCSETFTSVSQLVKHKQLHEVQSSFVCEVCGKSFTSEADLTEHHLVHNNEPLFPCNMCDRSFTTSHNLKRHKLLHVKDGRKCVRCGVLFCRRHNHVKVLPQTDSIVESEEDFSATEPQNVGSDLIPEKSLQNKLETSQVTKKVDDAQRSQRVTLLMSPPTIAPMPPVPGLIAKTCKAPALALHPRILSEILSPGPLKTSSVSHSPSPILKSSRNPSTSAQPNSPVPDYPTTSVHPNIPKCPELPPSLKIFSPQYLTSALLEVRRNYDYILNKAKKVKIEQIVKEEPVEPLVSSPVEKNVKQVKKEKIAYDLEIVL